MDRLEKSPYPIDTVWELIKSHFNVDNRADLLEHCYAKFQKEFFAELCTKLAVAATNGDQLSVHMFREAGRYLAKATKALLPNVSTELIKSGDLHIVCVGSVWNSWQLLKTGFTQEMNQTEIQFGIKLLKLTKPMALGAVYVGVDAIKYQMPKDYSLNYEIFHCYHQKIQTNGNTIV